MQSAPDTLVWTGGDRYGENGSVAQWGVTVLHWSRTGVRLPCLAEILHFVMFIPCLVFIAFLTLRRHIHPDANYRFTPDLSTSIRRTAAEAL